jgi:hypothetical protein
MAPRKKDELKGDVDERAEVVDLTFPSEHKKPNGQPVCLYTSEGERSALDGLYDVIVSDLCASSEGTGVGGTRTVRINSHEHSFPLNVPIKLFGFQVKALKGATYSAPEVVWDQEAGQLKQTGRLIEVSRFRVERTDTEYGI